MNAHDKQAVAWDGGFHRVVRDEAGAAEFGVDLNDNEEKAMKVHVYDSNGSKAEYDADDLETEGSELWVKKGDALVAVYAPGKWINGDVITDAEHA